MGHKKKRQKKAKKKRKFTKEQIRQKMANKIFNTKTVARKTFADNGMKGTFEVSKNLSLKNFRNKPAKQDELKTND